MPTLWENNKVAVTKEELVTEYWDTQRIKDAKKGEYYDIFWHNYNSLKMQLTRYKKKPYGIKRLLIGGNGRRLLVDFDTLSEDQQNVLGDPRKCDNPMEAYYQIDMNASDYYSSFRRKDRNLQPEEQEKYIINASVLNAALTLMDVRTNMRRNMSWSTTNVKETILRDVTNFNAVLRAKYEGVQHTLPANYRRFWELLNAYETAFNPEPKNAYYLLINDPEGNRVDNARKIFDKESILLKVLFAGVKKKPNKVEVARAYSSFLDGYTQVYSKETGELYDPKEYSELSDGAITAFLREWTTAIGTGKRRAGDRQKYINQYIPHAQKDRPEFAGSLYSIDDRQPPFWYEDGKRAWFYLGYDVAAGCFTTAVWGKNKKGLIVDFYRQMVRNYAGWGMCLPYELECESSLNSSYTETLLKDGNMFGKVRIERNNARGKRIERAFRELRYEVEKKNIGWIARPFAREESNQSHPGDNEITPYPQLIQDRLKDLEVVNNLPHFEDKTKTRWEYFCEKQNPNLTPINYQRILPFIGYHDRVYCRAGYMMLQGKKRAIAENSEILTGERLITKMTAIESKQVDIYWLDDNEENLLKALVYYKGRYVCEAQEMPRFSASILEREGDEKQEEAYLLQNKYITTVTAYAARQARAIGEAKKEIGIIEPTKTTNSTISFGLNNYRPGRDYSDIKADIVENDNTLHEDDRAYIESMEEIGGNSL